MCNSKLLVFVIGIFLVLITVKLKTLFEVSSNLKLEETWWKLTKPKNENTSIRSFKIHVTNTVRYTE